MTAAWAASERGKASRRQAVVEHDALRHPEREQAKRLVYRALRSGRLVREPCKICGASDVQAHHADYTRPLDVEWLCTAHHARIHTHPQP